MALVFPHLLIAFSTTSSGFIHIIVNDRISFFFVAERNTTVYVCNTFSWHVHQ